jgi:hypothetical protein
VREVAGTYRSRRSSVEIVFVDIPTAAPVGKKLVIVQDLLLDMVAKLGFQRGLARYKIR